MDNVLNFTQSELEAIANFVNRSSEKGFTFASIENMLGTLDDNGCLDDVGCSNIGVD
jgi:hypothetical protein